MIYVNNLMYSCDIERVVYELLNIREFGQFASSTRENVE